MSEATKRDYAILVTVNPDHYYLDNGDPETLGDALRFDAPLPVRVWAEYGPVSASTPEEALETFWTSAGAKKLRELPKEAVAELEFEARPGWEPRKREVELIERTSFRRPTSRRGPQAVEE